MMRRIALQNLVVASLFLLVAADSDASEITVSPNALEITVSPNPARLGDEIVLSLHAFGPCPRANGPFFDGDDTILMAFSPGRCFPPSRDFDLDVVLSPLDPGSYQILLVDYDFKDVLAALRLEVLADDATGEELAVSTLPNPAHAGDDVELRLAGYGSCPSANEPVFAGKAVAVQFTPGICAAPLRPFELKIALGRLTAGAYKLHVLDMFSGDVQATHDFEIGLDPSGTEPLCELSPTLLCLGVDGRFAAEVEWRDFSDRQGYGVAVPLRSADSGLFWFFNSRNWELTVKVLDGCAVNGYYWVLASATTNVEFKLRVTDTITGEVREFGSALGTDARAIVETSVFSCSVP